MNKNAFLKTKKMTSPINSFIRMITTPLGSRVMLLDFGSNLFDLIDRDYNSEWIIDFKRYCLEACFNEAEELWDERVYPSDLEITAFNSSTNTLKLSFKLTLQNNEEYEASIN